MQKERKTKETLVFKNNIKVSTDQLSYAETVIE